MTIHRYLTHMRKQIHRKQNTKKKQSRYDLIDLIVMNIYDKTQENKITLHHDMQLLNVI